MRYDFLDLWTTLTFDSDETYAHRHGVYDGDVKSSNTAEDSKEGARSPLTSKKIIRDDHIKVVTPTNVVVNQPHNPSNAATLSLGLNSLLAAFAMERYGGKPSQLSYPSLPPLTSSMAQLLAPPYVVPPHHNPLTPHPSSNSDESLVPVKGVRTCKASITAVDSPNYLDDSVSPSEAASNPLTAAEDKHQRNTAASAQLD